MRHPKLLIFILGGLISVASSQVRTDPNMAAGKIHREWWISAAAIVRVSLNSVKPERRFPLDPKEAGPILDRFKSAGISAVEIFAPYHGGNSFGGLDIINPFTMNPELGTMKDFRALVRMIHRKGMAVTVFINLGYASSEAPEFLKAEDDERAGKTTEETRRFLWSQTPDASPPGNDKSWYFLVGNRKKSFWTYSPRAGRYFWTTWEGPDLSGKVVRLPQYNWADTGFQIRAEKIVRFWMDQGVDGMVVDAVNWYLGYSWEVGRRRITDVAHSYRSSYLQPEGAGGFHEDPVAWITEGGWNSVQDYGLGIWWEKNTNVLKQAVETGNPRGIEQKLRDYHDRVVDAGGTLYYGPDQWPSKEQPEKTRMIVEAEALLGDLVALPAQEASNLDPEITKLFRIKSAHRALDQRSTRRQLPTDSDDKYYAFLRTASDRSERALVIMNFQPAAATVIVDLSGVACKRLIDLMDGSARRAQDQSSIDVPAFGYRLFAVE